MIFFKFYSGAILFAYKKDAMFIQVKPAHSSTGWRAFVSCVEKKNVHKVLEIYFESLVYKLGGGKVVMCQYFITTLNHSIRSLMWVQAPPGAHVRQAKVLLAGVPGGFSRGVPRFRPTY